MPRSPRSDVNIGPQKWRSYFRFHDSDRLRPGSPASPSNEVWTAKLRLSTVHLKA
jgi:hypothetical protein